jgi:hypothetical protein
MSSLGAILIRIQLADGSTRKIHESGCRNIAAALRVWLPMVRSRGENRKWHKGGSTPAHDAANAEALYMRVGESALAYFLDDRCNECEGATVDHDRRTCQKCKGTGKAELLMRESERQIALDLVSDLQGIINSHASRAAYAMREIEFDEVYLDRAAQRS